MLRTGYGTSYPPVSNIYSQEGVSPLDVAAQYSSQGSSRLDCAKVRSYYIPIDTL